ncbi:MAG: hypothetical protein AVDCRST_MAG80-270, partial [uncultured Rubrobacteraceae bacterium]
VGARHPRRRKRRFRGRSIRPYRAGALREGHRSAPEVQGRRPTL